MQWIKLLTRILWVAVQEPWYGAKRPILLGGLGGMPPPPPPEAFLVRFPRLLADQFNVSIGLEC